MAAEDALNSNYDTPELRLSRFLFLGKEFLDYQPGDWFVHKYFALDRVESILRLAEKTQTELVPIEIILKAFRSKLVPKQETLVFALAVCAKQTLSENLRHAAYDNIKLICASVQFFMLFIKFSTELSQQKELQCNSKSSHGWGHGMRTAINLWYNSKTPVELAKCVTRYKSRYGWKHKDILKLSHCHPSNFEKEIIFKYIIHGIKETKNHYEKLPEAEEMLKYFQNIEDFKHCEDDFESARLLEIHNLTLDHVTGHMLKSQEIWIALIPRMDMITLLTNLQRIHNLGFLKSNSPAVLKIVEQFNNFEYLSSSQIHPAFILIALRNYENSGKPLSYEKRKVRDQAKKPISYPPEPNAKIIDALYKALNLSFRNLIPTELRYMITINTNKTMFDNRAWQSGNLSCAEVGCIIALSFLRCEKDVTIATVKNSEIEILNIDKSASFPQAFREIVKVSSTIDNNMKLNDAILWALQKKEFDIFINIVDMSDALDNVEEDLKRYKELMKLPNTKLINCTVCSAMACGKNKPDKNCLLICGFDATVPIVITAFAKSLF